MLRKFYELMMFSYAYHARWEKEVSDNIFQSRRRLLLLIALLIPILVVGYLEASGKDFLGGKQAYGPVYYTSLIFWGSSAVGFIAGLITGCIGAGGGFVIAPALMSMGVKGIMAVGTDQFHIFAKAIMGTVIHKKLGNVNIALAIAFLIGSVGGATVGGYINRTLYNIDPILSDLFISLVYALILGILGFYALYDFIVTRRKAKAGAIASTNIKAQVGLTQVAIKLQSIKFPPPLIRFDEDFGGRQISWLFLAMGGFVVGLLAAIMGVGGGFITFPMFIFVFGVSTTTTVGTDIFQIIFTAGYASITQYAIYGFVFYTLAMGLLLGSLIGIQIGALTTKVVPGIVIRGFYALTILAGFVNRATVLPDKLRSLNMLDWSRETCYIIAQVGNVLFWGIIGAFGFWVLFEFFRHLKELREEV